MVGPVLGGSLLVVGPVLGGEFVSGGVRSWGGVC